MIAAIALTAYVVVAAVLAPRWLTAAHWPSVSPRCGIVAWQVLSASVLLAASLAAVALALPFLPIRTTLAAALGSHTVVVVEHYESPLGAWPGWLALGLLALGVVAVAVELVISFTRAANGRRRQHAQLDLLGRPDSGGYTVLEDRRPAAYCLPGRTAMIVVTSGAVDALDDQERRLVLGHERHHLAAHHHLALLVSGAFAHVLARVPLFVTAHAQIAVLAEMAADDIARTTAERRALARALVTLATGRRPEAALAAGDTAALARVLRLAGPRDTPVRGRAILAGVAALAATLLPLGVAVAPAVEAATRDCCTLVAPAVGRPLN